MKKKLYPCFICEKRYAEIEDAEVCESGHRSKPHPYRRTRLPLHPKSLGGSLSEHIAIAERAIGRFLPEGVQVHHVDGNKRNNANTNLVVCQDVAYHSLLHVRTRVVRAGGDPDTQRYCGSCRQIRSIGEFYRRKTAQYNSAVGDLLSTCCFCMRARAAARREQVRQEREHAKPERERERHEDDGQEYGHPGDFRRGLE